MYKSNFMFPSLKPVNITKFWWTIAFAEKNVPILVLEAREWNTSSVKSLGQQDVQVNWSD